MLLRSACQKGSAWVMRVHAASAMGARAASARLVRSRGYKNYVFSDTLRRLERECNRVCAVPVPRKQKVTILGAGSEVGMVASFMLKQQAIVRHLAMYDECACVLGAATDLAHIDTSAGVEAYQGQPYLCPALAGADVVLICGGEFPGGAGAPERESFAANARWVRAYVMAVAQFAPEAILAIQTPPVDANFSLAMHLLHKFDRRRLVGINAPSSMRASQLAGKPGTCMPVVCGSGRCTRVPVFGSLSNSSQSVECLTRLVREADEIVCGLKGGCGEAQLSVGFACARFAVELMKGLFEGSSTGDSGVVLTQGDDGLKVRSGPLTLGPDGVTGCLQPKLNEHEKLLYRESERDMDDMLRLGRCYATNEYYFAHPCKVYNSIKGGT